MESEKKDSLDNLSVEVTDVLCFANLNDLSIDLAEVTLDAIVKNEAMKHIPVFKTLLGIIETTQNISNYLFLKKIVAFLSNIKKVSAKKRKAMITEIDNSGKYKVKVGETLLNVIDKCDSTEKAAYLGTWFTAFLKEKISYDLFLNGAHIINNIFLHDFEYFLLDDADWMMVEDAYQEIAAGLFYVDFTFAFWDVHRLIDGKQSRDDVYEAGAKITPIGHALRSVLNPR